MSFKQKLVRDVEEKNCDKKIAIIYFTLFQIFSETVTKSTPPSGKRVIYPYHSPNVWEIGRHFVIASCRPRYNMVVYIWLVASLDNDWVDAMVLSSLTYVLQAALITHQIESYM